MMPRTSAFLLLAVFLAATSSRLVSASIFLPGGAARSLAVDLGRNQRQSHDATFHRRRSLQRALGKQNRHTGSTDGVLRHPLAMAIPGNSIAEQVVIGGFGNFLAIYNAVITARILLSWFPQAAEVAILQPVYQVTDPYLNLFRGIIPPIFGLDLSPILAFVTLNLLTSSTATLAAELPREGGAREKLAALEQKGKRAMRRGWQGRRTAL